MLVIESSFLYYCIFVFLIFVFFIWFLLSLIFYNVKELYREAYAWKKLPKSCWAKRTKTERIIIELIIIKRDIEIIE